MNYIVKLMTVRCYSTNVYNDKLMTFVELFKKPL